MLRRNRKPSEGDALVASALIDLSDEVDRAYLRSTRQRTVRDARNAWRWYSSIAEVHYGISRSARIAGYTKLIPHELNSDGSIGPVATAAKVVAVANQLYSPWGGTRQLAARFYTLMKVPAEAHLIRCRDEDGNPDGYDFLSADELDIKEIDTGKALARITSPSTSGGSQEAFRIPINNEDYIGRVWNPSARYVDLTDSPLSAADGLCEQLDLLTKSTIARLKSRIAQAGLLLLPAEIVVSDDRKPEDIVYDKDPLVDKLYRTWTKAIRDNRDPAAVVPHILRGPSEALDKVRFVFSDREIMQVDMELRQELIDRILTGLDSQKATVKGTGENTNHWGAWAESDEERRVAIQPDMEMLAWTMTRMVFQADLEAAEVANPGKYVLVADMSLASAKTNQGEDVRQLFDRGAVKAEAMRHAVGIREEDKMDDDEYIRWVGRQTKNPRLMLHGIEADLDWEEIEKWGGQTGPAPDSTGDKATTGPGVGDPGSPDSNDSDTPRSKRPA